MRRLLGPLYFTADSLRVFYLNYNNQQSISLDIHIHQTNLALKNYKGHFIHSIVHYCIIHYMLLTLSLVLLVVAVLFWASFEAPCFKLDNYRISFWEGFMIWFSFCLWAFDLWLPIVNRVFWTFVDLDLRLLIVNDVFGLDDCFQCF